MESKALVGWLAGVLALVSVLTLNTPCYGDSAEVLPQGRVALFVEGKFYRHIDKQYDENGDKEGIADKYNANINNGVIPQLPPGLSLGQTVVDYQYHLQIIEFNFAYGLTDKLSFGTKIPYWIFKNNVNAELDTTNANLGANPQYGTPTPWGATQFLPTTSPVPGVVPAGVKLTTQQFQQLLGPGLDLNNDGTIDIPGYGYKPVKTWDHQGVSDIEAFLRYQYYRSENFRLAATGGVRMPTGWTDDIDSLVDYPSGAGAWAGLLRLNQDYIGTKDLFLTVTLKYDYYIKDRNYERVPDSVDQPLTTNKERVDRQYGPFFELEATAAYNLWKGLGPFAVYRYGYKWKNQVHGDKGYDYNSLEDETEQKAQEYIIGLQYSTIPMYLKGEFPIPITAFLGYRNRFAGENCLASEYIDAGLAIYF